MRCNFFKPLFFSLIGFCSATNVSGLEQTPPNKNPISNLDSVESKPPLKASSSEPSHELSSSSQVSIRLDCLHDFNRDKGTSQSCISISGLRYSTKNQLHNSITARLRIDPFATLDSGQENSPLRDDLPKISDSNLILIDDYGLTWTPRPNLDLALERYNGAVKLPRVTGLAFENPFDNPGWQQTALTITYNLSALSASRVRFAIGNGEGENTENLDPQQYFGFEFNTQLVQGINFKIGISQDGNSLGSAQYKWLADQFDKSCGFSFPNSQNGLGYRTQRIAAGLTMDGNFAAIPGLHLALSGQRASATDLDKSRTAYAIADDFASCKRIDTSYLFVETNPNQDANTVHNTTFNMSLGFQLLDQYTLAGSYSTRIVDTGKVRLFESCDAFSAGICTTEASQRRAYDKFSEDSLTIGGGVELSPGLSLTLEYARMNLDRKYAKVNYVDKADRVSDTWELFNARVAYNWQ